MTHHTGLFRSNPNRGGPRAVCHALADRLDERDVAEALADGLSLRQVAARLGISPARVAATFSRICGRLGPQALGTWRIEP